MRRIAAGLSLIAYLACALLLPELHRRYHAAHGDDHVHIGGGIVQLHDDDSAAHEHAEHDADLAALGLDGVAAAGTSEVDCTLAEYTLVECGDARADHPFRFGDELLARLHHHSAGFDPMHGRGSLAHLQGWLLAPAPLLPLPPPAPLDAPLPPSPLDSVSQPLPATAAARGPPAVVAC